MPYLTTRKNLKLQLRPGLVASYDIQPGNGVGLFWDTTHTPDPHRGRCDKIQDASLYMVVAATAAASALNDRTI